MLEGLPYEVIAAHTGVSVGTVKSRISRARDTLERLLLEGDVKERSETVIRPATHADRETDARLTIADAVFHINPAWTCELKMGILSGRDVCLGRESVEGSSFHAQCAMANDNEPQKDRAAEAARDEKVKEPATERPFDMWLHKQLHAMYDEITAEPLPNDLINLIDRDADKSKQPPKKK